MAPSNRMTLQQYLALNYPFSVIADPEGGYVIEYPDLPGCMTQVEDISEVSSMADEIRQLWIETAYDREFDIPLPSYPEEYSGKFNVRLPRSLHRKLAESAKREGVSLNQHVVALLSEEVTVAQIAYRLGHVESKLDVLSSRLRFQVTGTPGEARAMRRYSASHLSVVEANEPMAV